MTNTDYNGSKTWIPSPNNYWKDRLGRSPSFIILHGTAGGYYAENTAYYLNSVGLSVHYIIGKNGRIVQMVHEADAAWGNGILDQGHDPWWNESVNPNLLTISIEHCKTSSANSDLLTPLQQEASFNLIRDICNRNGIPKRKADANGGITGHYSLEPINRKDCPGPYPWSALFQFLSGVEPVDAKATYNGNKNIQLEFNTTWDSILGNPIVPNSVIAPKGTGIFWSWVEAWLSGVQFGPPLTRELDMPDKNGNPMKVQIFTDGRCEWYNSQPHWYSTNGAVNWNSGN